MTGRITPTENGHPQHRLAAEAGRAVTAHAIAEAARRIQARRTQIDTDAMEVRTDV